MTPVRCCRLNDGIFSHTGGRFPAPPDNVSLMVQSCLSMIFWEMTLLDCLASALFCPL